MRATAPVLAVCLALATSAALAAPAEAAARKPSAPRSVKVVAKNGAAAVSWGRPSSTGGAAILGYRATASPGGRYCTTTKALACTITGLHNYTRYIVRVTARNRAGTGTASAAVYTTPLAVPPSAPGSVRLTPGQGALTVTWARPSSTGGSAVTTFRADALPGTRSCSTTGLSCTITGLANGTRYAVRVTARNRAGAGAASAAQYATPRTVPGSPTAVKAVPGDGQALVRWTAPTSTGGAALSGHLATATPSGRTCTAAAGATSCTVTGLTNGRREVVQVRARNAAGYGAGSVTVSVLPAPTGALSFTGDTTTGQAGNGVSGLEPTRVTRPRSTWATYSAGEDHTCATLADTSLWCWGGNATGQLGLGDTDRRTAPTQVGTGTGWTRVEAGTGSTCATKDDGTLWCWGRNDVGQLGLGTTTDAHAPTQVGTDTDWLRVDAGLGSHVCAVRSTGTLWCWGHDDVGQLGLGTTTDAHAPTQVGTDTDWTAVSVGADHTCGLRGTGIASCWGGNAHGQVGNGSTTPSTVPVVVGAATDWQQVSAGDGHTCGRRVPTTVSNPGSLWCWGRGDAGQLGTGNRTDVTVPTSASAFTYWTDVSAGSLWTCGHRAGELLCWGTQRAAGLGGPTTDGPATPEAFAVWTWPVPAWDGVEVGARHGCALSDNGDLRCWGDGAQGQIGHDVRPTSPIPVSTSRTWAALSASDGAACAVSTDGALRCWGESTTYRLPFGGVAPVTTAQVVAGSWADVGLGTTSGCGVQSDNTLWCWGAQTYGQVGTGVSGGSAPAALPTRVGTLAGWGRVSVGATHACATRLDGSLWCWGDGTAGALGDGGTGVVAVPARVGSGTWASVTAGDHVTCATATDTTLWCWGDVSGSVGGGLGLADLTGPLPTPTQVGTGTGWAQVALGDGFGCATRTDGTLWCWGANGDGRLGVGDTTDRGEPTQVGSGTTWTSVTAGTAYACAVRADATAWCWGRGTSGQLGDGTAASSSVPVKASDAAVRVVAAGRTTYVVG